MNEATALAMCPWSPETPGHCGTGPDWVSRPALGIRTGKVSLWRSVPVRQGPLVLLRLERRDLVIDLLLQVALRRVLLDVRVEGAEVLGRGHAEKRIESHAALLGLRIVQLRLQQERGRP